MLRYLQRSPLTRARRAARLASWAEAADFYRRHLDRHPEDSAAWIQLGHSHKELGEFVEARAAYEQATKSQPENVDGWIQLAHIARRTDDREVAIGVLENGLSVNPQAERIMDEMLAAGARDRLPITVQKALEERRGAYSLARYSMYRARQFHRENRPESELYPDVLAVIDARNADPALVLVTKETLGQATCMILEGDSEPTAGIRIHANDRICELASSFRYLLLVEAGCRLEPDLISQIRSAMELTGAIGGYCDYDRWQLTAEGIEWTDPCFQPMHDPLWFDDPAAFPPCVLIDRKGTDDATTWHDIFFHRMALPVAYAHVPQVLAGRCIGLAKASPRVIKASSQSIYGDIQVIIQTRDAPDMLERCVSSLLDKADQPDHVDLVIMDNRSILPETAILLKKMSDQGIARIISHDEPFNWARANNIATRMSDSPYLLFLNNDVEMDSDYWDIMLRKYIDRKDIGVAGARLIYPDRRLQHAGVIFGMETGGPVHEGVGQRLGNDGPSERWLRPRLASAVTGAWLATSREMFGIAGGFDERLPVAYNDIDFCLRCRAADRYVVQASDIRAIHRESATRGTTLSDAELAREQREWSWLQERWGDALNLDPAYNPHWLRTGQPFDGFGAPSPEAMARWISQSARQRPWAVHPLIG